MTACRRFLLGLLVCGIRAGALAAENDLAAFDARILGELEAADPEAARLMREANEAREERDHAAAAARYGRVRERVPTFDHAIRRQAVEELALGHRESALQLAREALALAETPENLTALAGILIAGVSKPSDREPIGEAKGLVRRALESDPESLYGWLTLAQIALAADDLALLEEATQRLLTIAPDELPSQNLRFLVAASRGRRAEAEAALNRARELGMSEEDFRAARQSLLASRSLLERWGPPGIGGVIAWLGAGLVLFAVGGALSRATLRAAERLPSEASGRAAGFDARLRRAYRAVLWLGTAYYWISMPILAVVVLAAGGGVLYGFFALGRIPIKLVIIVVVTLGVTLVAIAKSLFVRVRDEDPGLPVDPAAEPRLAKVLEEVAAKIGTRPVDRVYLTPGTELAVMERGGMGRQLRGRTERCLILGVGVLEGMTVKAFKAILAHEYGHFSNRDTAGGGFALAVRRSLVKMAASLAEGGAARWYNPAWLFFQGFYRVFLRISQGASRLQEVLADRWAAFAYGSPAFAEGLRHVIARAVRFDAHADATLGEVIEGRRPLPNLYAYRPQSGIEEAELAARIEAAMLAEPSAYDSHPAPHQRLRWVAQLAAQAASSPDDETPVWTLLQDREGLERRLTELVRENLRQQHAIEIPAAAERAPAG